MFLALDVHYRNDTAHAAGVAFARIDDAQPQEIYTAELTGIADYQPGAFWRRELPPILHLLRSRQLQPDSLIIDGHVYLDGHTRPGLGARLYQALDARIPVIGVAKQAFHGMDPACALYRGQSRRPLYVTAAGLPGSEAQALIASMAGEGRIPTLLRLVDRISRAPVLPAAA